MTMGMSTWAEKEIEFACVKERANSNDSDEWKYGCACYVPIYLKSYEDVQERLMNTYGIYDTHAACYLSNFCRNNCVGCKHLDSCMRIDISESGLLKE